jgi:hypothetical protein
MMFGAVHGESSALSATPSITLFCQASYTWLRLDCRRPWVGSSFANCEARESTLRLLFKKAISTLPKLRTLSSIKKLAQGVIRMVQSAGG